MHYGDAGGGLDEREPVPVHYGGGGGGGGVSAVERVPVYYGNGDAPAEAAAPFTHMPTPQISVYAAPPKPEPSTGDERGGVSEAAEAAAAEAASGGASLGFGGAAPTGAAVDGRVAVPGEAPFTAAGRAAAAFAGGEAAAAGGPNCLSG